jgi:hypothetical protein
MENEIIQLGATAVVAITAFKAIEYIVNTFVKRDTKNIHPLCQNIITLETLFKTNLETQKETSKLIHNTLHTTDEELKENRRAVGILTTQIEVLKNTIEERIPKKRPFEL